MKTLFTSLLLMCCLASKGQTGSILIGSGATIFTGSLVYYIVGEPNYTVHTQAGYDAYTKELNRYKKLSTGGMIGGGALLITGLFIHSNEVRVGKNATASFSPNSLTFTYTWPQKQ